MNNNKNVHNKKKYYKKNAHNKNVNKNIETNKKLTYDEIVNVREDASEIIVNKDNIPVLKYIALSTTILAIIFGSLLLFRVI